MLNHIALLLLQVDSTGTGTAVATSFWHEKYWGHSLKNWAIFLAILLGSLIVAKLFYWLTGSVIKKLTEKTKTKLDDILVDMLEEPVVLIIVGIGVWVGYEGWINYKEIDPEVHNFIWKMIGAYFTLVITWLIARFIDALVKEYLLPLADKSESDFDDQILPIVQKGLRIVIWVLGFIVALQNAGFDIAALLAGLGIGGLALALAAQDSVKNIFGGIMIFADKPFKIKDRIKVIGLDGTVEEIGIRSTRLRTLEGRLITIPNGMFSDNPIENVSAEPFRRVDLALGLTYDTTPEQIEQAMGILREIANAQEYIDKNDIRTGFTAFGDFALGISLTYFITDSDYILSTQTALNLEVLKRFNAAGLDMAFPTQTLYTIPQKEASA